MYQEQRQKMAEILAALGLSAQEQANCLNYIFAASDEVQAEEGWEANNVPLTINPGQLEQLDLMNKLFLQQIIYILFTLSCTTPGVRLLKLLYTAGDIKLFDFLFERQYQNEKLLENLGKLKFLRLELLEWLADRGGRGQLFWLKPQAIQFLMQWYQEDQETIVQAVEKGSGEARLFLAVFLASFDPQKYSNLLQWAERNLIYFTKQFITSWGLSDQEAELLEQYLTIQVPWPEVLTNREIRGEANRQNGYLLSLVLRLCLYLGKISETALRIIAALARIKPQRTLEGLHYVIQEARDGRQISFVKQSLGNLPEVVQEYQLPLDQYYLWLAHQCVSVNRGFTAELFREAESHPEALSQAINQADGDEQLLLLTVARTVGLDHSTNLDISELYLEFLERYLLTQELGVEQIAASLAFLRGEIELAGLLPQVEKAVAKFSFDYRQFDSFSWFLWGTKASPLLGRIGRLFLAAKCYPPVLSMSTAYLASGGKTLGFYQLLLAEKVDQAQLLAFAAALASDEDARIIRDVDAFFSSFSYQDYELQRLDNQDYLTELIQNQADLVITALDHCIPAARAYLLEQIFHSNADRYAPVLVNYLADSSKKVRTLVINLLQEYPSAVDLVKLCLSSAKLALRESAVQILAPQSDPQVQELLYEVYSKEKNLKLRNTLANLITGFAVPNEDTNTKRNIVGYCQNKLTGVHKRILAWLDPETLPTVSLVQQAHSETAELGQQEHSETSELSQQERSETAKPAQQDLLKRSHQTEQEQPKAASNPAQAEESGAAYVSRYLLTCYATSGEVDYHQEAAEIAKFLQPAELSNLILEVLERWYAAGAPLKNRWVLAMAALHGDQRVLAWLRKKIEEWPQQSRSTLACIAVHALALAGTAGNREALHFVDNISRKFRSRPVREAAAQALDSAADSMNMDREELADRLVPDLGLNSKGEKILDFGPRSFMVRLNKGLELELFSADGKKLKSMPKPGQKDDQQLAQAASDQFKSDKRQLKTVISNQKLRLEQALAAQRLWSVETWVQFFLENPLMQQLSAGLIWGVFAGGPADSSTPALLGQTFRCLGDGTFTTPEDEEYQLPTTGKIGLVHPIDLEEGVIAAWREQLIDYEIQQPFDQLGRKVCRLLPEEINSLRLGRFRGRKVMGYSLLGRLTKGNWSRGPIADGSYCEFIKEVPPAGLRAELHITGLSLGHEEEDTVLEDLVFYHLGEAGQRSYGGSVSEQPLPLNSIPRVFFSEIVTEVDQATATNGGSNNE